MTLVHKMSTKPH